ncbi:hypothetical protein L1049_013485 [Liquidambar formosana]|uniref:Uncharacterized protein n=1 Tax=Liquidambar formosana TaxID=63359 RepID=A0AAP0WY63_LIQFO
MSSSAAGRWLSAASSPRAASGSFTAAGRCADGDVNGGGEQVRQQAGGHQRRLLLKEEALSSASTIGYFNSAQAMIDYAAVIIYVKKKLSAENSPVIVIGASYGGMLASWFQLKYPHIATGALASSAPILYFDDITPQDGYYSTVEKDFREASESCYETIRKSWSEIDRVAFEANGLSTLSKRFKTCNNLNNSVELKDYLSLTYTGAAQYNRPPNFQVTMVCRSIDGASEGTDILGRIYAGIVSYRGNRSCYNTTSSLTEISVGWKWQVNFIPSISSGQLPSINYGPKTKIVNEA